jgi:hypothetical protein
MPQQRRLRNREERERIVQECRDNLAKLSMPDDHPGIAKLNAELDKFLAMEREGAVIGVIELADFGSKIEYHLPTRRIVPQLVRFAKLDKLPHTEKLSNATV